MDLAFGPFLVAIVVLVPLAVGIAVVRYDLYDVDRLLGTSAAWVVTLVLSASAYSVVVLAVGQTVHDLTPLGSSVAAFVTALLLLPLHRWVTKAVGRFVDRDRHVAVAAMERFTADVRAGRREPEQVEQALRDAQRDPNLRILLAAADGTWVGMEGRPAVAEDGFTLEAGGSRSPGSCSGGVRLGRGGGSPTSPGWRGCRSR